MAIETPTLNRLHAREQLLSPDGTPSHRFMAIWQELAEKIEAAFTAIDARDDIQDGVIADIQAVVDREALAKSFVDPVVVLTADDTGTVTIAAHERVYYDADLTRVAVDGGTVTGLTLGDQATIYYIDADREGGAVTYQATVNPIAQRGNVHILGIIRIPLATEPEETGVSVVAPGYRLSVEGNTGLPGGGTGGSDGTYDTGTPPP